MNAHGLDQSSIHPFLSQRFARVADLESLQGGEWSSAYGFNVGSDQLVVRFGPYREDFEKEDVASTWRLPALPIPEVLEIGDAFGGAYIVSRRKQGVKLADVESSRVNSVVRNLVELLVSVQTIRLPGTGYGIWLAPTCNAPYPSWRAYLQSVRDRDESRLVDWRAKLSAFANGMETFSLGCEVFQAQLRHVPNTRHVIHADLLLNHLIAPDNSVSAIFDWGNAMAGDPLYDIAWIAACIPWFPSIDRSHLLAVARSLFGVMFSEERLKIYEFHILLAEMPYLAFADRGQELMEAFDRLKVVLAEFGH